MEFEYWWLLGFPLFFGLGAFFGILALLGTVLRQRREIALLKQSMEPPPAAPLIPPPI